MTHLPATAERRRQRRRYVVPVVAVLAVAMLGAVMTLAASTPQARAQLADTTCYTINDVGGDMVSWTSGTQTAVGNTGLTGVESLAANQDRNELWSYDDNTSSMYSFTPGSATPTLEFGFTAAGAGGLDGLTWVNHTDGDPANDQLWGTIRNGVNDAPNEADEIVQIDPATGAVIGSVVTITDPGAGSDELDDNDGLIWDPVGQVVYGVIGGDTTANLLTSINPATGAITSIPLTLNGGDVYDIESLGAGTDGQLYGTTGEDNGPTPPGNTDANQFVSIDKNSGAVTVIGALPATDFEATACLTAEPFGVTPATCYAIDEGNGDDNHLVEVNVAADGTFTFTDLGIVNDGNGVNTQTVESIAYRNGFEPYALYTYNPSTNSLMRVNTADGTDVQQVAVVDLGDIDGLTWRFDNDTDPTNDELWGVQRFGGAPLDQLVQIDPLTGAILSGPIPIATGGAGAENDVDGLAWDPTNPDFFYAPVNGSGSNNELITITTAGVVQTVGLMGVQDVEGIGFTDSGELFGSTGATGPPADSFLAINKATGEATNLGSIPIYADYESLDCAGIAPVPSPSLDIITTIIDATGTCPATFADAQAFAGLDTIQVAPATQDVKYCFDIINNGPGDAQNVVISSPALAAPIIVGDLAVGEEAMGMTTLAPANSQPATTTGFVNGTDTQGVPQPQDSDPSGYVVVDAPVLEIVTTIIPEGDTCPVDYDAAVAGGFEGLDTIQIAAPGDANVKYCYDIINSGLGDATNVVISSPALAADIVIGDLAAGAQAMGMTELAPATDQGTTTDGFVNGEDILGNAVPEDTDPSGYEIVDAPSVDIRLTVVDAGDTCPATYAEAIEGDGAPLQVIDGQDIQWCINVINNGPGTAQNVVVTYPFPGGPTFPIGTLTPGQESDGAIADTYNTGDPLQTTDAVDGQDLLGNALPQQTDPALLEEVLPPSLEIVTTIIREGETCPVDYDAAVAAGNEGLDTIQVAAPGDANVKYCYDIINNGPGAAQNVVISSPALAADIVIGDLAVDEQAMGMTELAPATDEPVETIGFVDGEDILGNAVPQDEDPSGYEILNAPILEIVTTIIREGETCPVDFDAAVAAGNEGLDTIQVAAPGDENVKYCYDIINSGATAAQNVVISSPALAADILIGDLAVGEQAMGMTELAPATDQGTTTDGFVNGEDLLGNALPQDEDPSGYEVIPAPSLEIVTTIIPEGDTCPVDFNAAVAAGFEGLDTIQVADAATENVKYCYDIINNGPGAAQNVVISSPALAADILIGDLAVGEQAMGMTELAPAGDQGTTTDGFVNGEDLLGNAVPQDTDPSGYEEIPAPSVDIRLTVIREADTCPATYAEAIEGDGPALDIFVGESIKHCFNVINNGPGDAQNVVITYGATTLDIPALAANGQAVGMTNPAPFQDGDPVQTTAFVDGEDLLGNALPQQSDPDLVNPSAPLATIGDFVWRDNNRDGTQDGNEPGIEGVLVSVWSVEPNGDLGSVVATDFTDAVGDWGADVAPGTYRVFFSLPAGAEGFSPQDAAADDIDSDVTPAGALAGWTGDYVVANGDSNQTIDAGIFFPIVQARLGDFVWEDINRDGIQDGAELGIDGIDVEVFDANGVSVGTTTTANGGLWGLDVDPGTYTVQFTNDTAGVFTLPNVGDDTTDSDVDDTGLTTVAYTVGEDEEDLTIDAGIYFLNPAIGLAKDLTGGPTRIGQTANYDVSYTFVISNIGELDLTAVTLTDNVAVGLAATAGSVVSGPTPNAAGSCSTAVALGTQALAVGESCTAVWDFVIANPGGAALAWDNSASVAGTPPTGPDVTDVSDDGSNVDEDGDGNANEPGENDPTPAAIPALASLGDFVFEDANDNNIQDGADSAVPGVVVELLDANGDPIPGIPADTTDAAGAYGFDNLDPGTYIVRFNEPAGRTFVTANAGADDVDSDADETTGETAPIVLTAGENDPTIDAGLSRIPGVGSISNLVFEDLDGDDVQDPGEPGVEGATVELLDANGDPVPGVPAQTTGPDGEYVFADLPAGQYQVRFTAPLGREFVIPNIGGDDTLDSDANPITGLTELIDLAEDQDITDVDAGIDPLPPVIGLAKDLTAGPTLLADGTHSIEYSFVIENLGPVDLTNVQIIDDFAATFPGLTVTGPIPSGGTCDSADAFTGAAALAVGESCTAIWTVIVTGAVPGTTYDNTAQAFGEAPDGVVAVDDSDDGTVTDTDGDGNADEPGENDPTPATIPDALLGTIGDFVWEDVNGDDQQAGESGIAGVVVTLLDGTGAPVAGVPAQTTGADGAYLFTDLPAGDYIVDFEAPAGRTFVTPLVGDPAEDSDAGAGATDQSAVITLAAGEDNLTIDAGIAPLPPVIGLAKDLTAGPTLLADGTHSIEYSFVIENLGPVDLTNVQITDDFAATFPGLTVAGPIPSGGTCDSLDAFTGAAALAVGESCTAIWTVVVTGAVPGTTYDNTATVAGTAPDGTVATDTSDDGTVTDPDGDGNPDEPGENDPTPATIPDALLGSIGDFVWEDINGDGLQAGEAGIEGLTVTLLDAVGAPVPGVPAQTTSADGAYLFTDLPAGTYIVQFTAPNGRTFTTADAGDDAADSDAGSNGQSPTIVLGAGEDVTNVDAGIAPPAPVIGLAKDVTAGPTLLADGTHSIEYSFVIDNLGPVDLTNVQITDNFAATFPGLTVAGPTPSGGTCDSADAFTGATALAVGESCTAIWTVIVTGAVPGTTYDNTATVAGTAPDGTVATDTSDDGTVTDTDGDGNPDEPTENDPTPATIPDALLGSIGNFVWEDINGDGQQAGEAGIAGVVVTLLDAAGAPVPGVPAQTTGADGAYEFTDLPAGTYIVQFTAPNGRTFTTADAGDDATDSDAGSNGQSPTIVLGAGETVVDVDAGIAPLAPVIGLAKALTAGPTLLADGTHEIQYSFVVENLGPVDLTNVQITDNFAATFPGLTVTGPVPSGGTCDSAAAFTGAAALAVGESCTAIWTVVVTGAVPGATYDNVATVAGTAPDGAIATDTADDGTVTDPDGDGNPDEPTENDPTPATIPAALLGTISDTVFSDDNSDGINGAGEAGIPGLTVTLLDANGNPVPGVAPVVTDGQGMYAFTDLPAGNYIVEFTTPEGRSFTSPNVGDDATDSDAGADGRTTVITLGAGEILDDVDAGIAPAPVAPDPATIGDLVFSDLNGNGVQDDGEPGVAGVRVEVLDADGNLLTDVTDANGAWDITVSAGEYVVTFVKPDGTAYSPANQGADTSDSDADPADGSVTVTAIAGVDNPTIDAGLVPLGSIGDLVFNDANSNGARDAGEATVAGAKVELFIVADDGTRTSKGTVTTGSDGAYNFDELVAGNYIVVVTPPSGFVAGPQDADADAAVNNDISPATGESSIIGIGIGESVANIDAGVVPAPVTTVVTPSTTFERLPIPNITNAPPSPRVAVPAAPVSPPLAVTGSSSAVLATLAMAMMAVGGTMFIGARREGEQE